MTLETAKWIVDARISYLEENLVVAKTVQEVNEINYAIEELEQLKIDFIEEFNK